MVPASTSEPLLLKALRSASAPLLSLFVLILGNGLYTTLTPLRLHLDGYETWLVGLVATANYVGLVLGAFRMEPFIIRVGHIRAYAALASMLGVVCLVQGLIVNPWLWVVLRLLAGYAVAGLYLVIESWLLATSKVNVRGQVLSLYMIALYGGQAGGQFLLNISHPSSLIPFCIATIFASLSVIPLCMTRSKSPHIDEPEHLPLFQLYRKAPIGVMGAMVAGLILGGIYGLMPLFVTQAGYGVSDVAWAMGAVILGGMALQYPVGKTSDKFDRRRVLFILSLCTLGVAVIMPVAAHIDRESFLGLLFLFGGLTFTLYPLSISHACDHITSSATVAATQGLLLCYGTGAALGPLFASGWMHVMGYNGLFAHVAMASLSFAVFVYWRMGQRKSIPLSKQDDFVVVPPATTPIATELDPRSDAS